jgi:membrane protein
VLSGTLWQLSQWIYVDFQVGVAKYNAIYGTLAALPIFMIWLYLAWAILLLGLEVTYAVQNLQSVCQDLRGGRVSIVGRTRAILAVLLHLARRFQRGEPAPAAESIAAELSLPPRLLLGILELLQRRELVVEVTGAGGFSGYLPAREPDAIQLTALLGSIAVDGADYMPPEGCAEHAVIIALVDRLAMTAGGSLTEVTLRDLVDQVETAGKGEPQSAGER